MEKETEKIIIKAIQKRFQALLDDYVKEGMGENLVPSLEGIVNRLEEIHKVENIEKYIHEIGGILDSLSYLDRKFGFDKCAKEIDAILTDDEEDLEVQ